MIRNIYNARRLQAQIAQSAGKMADVDRVRAETIAGQEATTEMHISTHLNSVATMASLNTLAMAMDGLITAQAIFSEKFALIESYLTRDGFKVESRKVVGRVMAWHQLRSGRFVPGIPFKSTAKLVEVLSTRRHLEKIVTAILANVPWDKQFFAYQVRNILLHPAYVAEVYWGNPRDADGYVSLATNHIARSTSYFAHCSMLDREKIEVPQLPEVFRAFMMAIVDVAADGKDRYKPAAQLRQLQRLFFNDERVRHDQNSEEAKVQATTAYLKRNGGEPAQAKSIAVPANEDDEDDDLEIQAAIKRARLFHDAMANASCPPGQKKAPYAPRITQATSASTSVSDTPSIATTTSASTTSASGQVERNGQQQGPTAAKPSGTHQSIPAAHSAQAHQSQFYGQVPDPPPYVQAPYQVSGQPTPPPGPPPAGHGYGQPYPGNAPPYPPQPYPPHSYAPGRHAPLPYPPQPIPGAGGQPHYNHAQPAGLHPYGAAPYGQPPAAVAPSRNVQMPPELSGINNNGAQKQNSTATTTEAGQQKKTDMVTLHVPGPQTTYVVTAPANADFLDVAGDPIVMATSGPEPPSGMFVFDPTTSTLTPVKTGSEVASNTTPKTPKDGKAAKRDGESARRALSGNMGRSNQTPPEGNSEDAEAVRHLLRLESNGNSSEKENF